MSPRRLALITGAGRNLGRATAIALAREGFDIAVNVRSDQASGERTAGEARALGVDAEAFAAEVADEAAVRGMFERISIAFGRSPDVLVNSASIRPRTPFTDITLDEWHEVLGVTLDGAFLCARAAAPGMMERGWGRIVNVIGRAAFTGQGSMAHVASAKAGLHGLTKSLAQALGPYGITANSVSPGPIRADDGSLPGGATEASLLPRIPVGRIATMPDIAAIIAFLVTEPGMVTGQVIHADGGEFIA